MVEYMTCEGTLGACSRLSNIFLPTMDHFINDDVAKIAAWSGYASPRGLKIPAIVFSVWLSSILKSATLIGAVTRSLCHVTSNFWTDKAGITPLI